MLCFAATSSMQARIGSSGLSAAVREQEKGAQPFTFAGRAVQARRTRFARTTRCWTRSRAGQRLLKPCRGVGRDAREKNPGHEPENWRPPSEASELLVLQVLFNTPRTRDNTYGMRTHTRTPPRTGARTGTGTGWPFGVMDRLGPSDAFRAWHCVHCQRALVRAQHCQDSQRKVDTKL